MKAQKRHVRTSALVFVATGVSDACRCVRFVLRGELSQPALCEAVCCSKGSRSCVAIIS